MSKEAVEVALILVKRIMVARFTPTSKYTKTIKMLCNEIIVKTLFNILSVKREREMAFQTVGEARGIFFFFFFFALSVVNYNRTIKIISLS